MLGAVRINRGYSIIFLLREKEVENQPTTRGKTFSVVEPLCFTFVITLLFSAAYGQKFGQASEGRESNGPIMSFNLKAEI